MSTRGSRSLPLLAILPALAALAGCGDARPVAKSAAVDDCARCHADPPATGAHTVHVDGRGIACTTCHGTNAGGPGHFGGGQPVIQYTGLAVADGATPTYDAATQTCSGVYCHGGTINGGTQRSPAWTGSLSGCTSCHGLPPVPPHSPTNTACTSCHPDPASPTHVNGRVDLENPHAAGFSNPAVHGPQFLDHLAGVPGTLDCQTCHGADLASCGACHSKPANGGWVSWSTNCTFCHGTRTATYDFSSSPAAQYLAAPPDAVAQRLSGSTDGTQARTGKHRVHVNGTSGSFVPLPCATCHVVPATLDHVTADRRAAVEMRVAAAFPGLTPEQQATLRTPLPDPLSTYVPGSGSTPGTCGSNYCHGATMQGGTSTPNLAVGAPSWTVALTQLSCASCHGNPPPTGRRTAANPSDPYCPDGCSIHEWHNAALPDLGYERCGACHAGNVHVNGFPDIGWGTGITGTWDPVAKTCALACHGDPAPRAWYPANAPPVVHAGPDAGGNEGETISISATFSDPEAGDTHTATVSWGDGSPPEAAAVSGTTVSASHVYGDNGGYAVTVCVTDSAGGTGCGTLHAAVANVAPTVAPVPNQTVAAGATLDVTAQFTDPGTLDTHTAEADWGDGTAPAPMIVGSGTAEGSHVYAAAGFYAAMVCVTDDDAGRGCASFVVTVAP